MAKLDDTTSTTIIPYMKSVFARFDVVLRVAADNEPQYSAREFVTFASEYDLIHITSSYFVTLTLPII